MSYAEHTTVSAENSRMGIERILRRYGASAFSYGWEEDRAVVMFRASDRAVRFIINMPDRKDRRFTHHSRGVRTAAAAEKEWEQATRQRWRVLALVVKAKLEAVATGITTFEDEFLAHILLPNGETVGDWMSPQVQEAYERGVMPSMLPQLGRGGT